MKPSTKYSPEVRERAVRLVLEHQGAHGSQWSAIPSVASKLGCTAQTLPPPGGGRVVRLADLGKHPLDSGDFQLEDMWICEKIQRNLHSSKYRVGPMAEGPGAESPVTHFQRSVLDYLEGMAGEGVE